MRYRVSFRGVLDVVAALAMLATAVVLIVEARPFHTRAHVPVPTAPLTTDGAALLGQPDAKLVLLEFSDFQCPYCSAFARETLPRLRSRFVDPGLLQVAFRHLPLAIHPAARGASAAAVCAGEQGHFWDVHDALFAMDGKFTNDQATGHAAVVGLDTGEFNDCLANSAGARVDQDVQLARSLGVTSTPTFFLGTRQLDGGVRVSQVLVGARPSSEFEAAIARLAGFAGI